MENDMKKDIESVDVPEIHGTYVPDEYLVALYSIAKSLKRIADRYTRPYDNGDA